MERVRQGEGTSFLFLDNAGASQRAQQAAEIQLREALQRSCDPVPCPACGRIQEHMLPRARRSYRRWMRVGGLYLFVGAAFLFIGGIVLSIASERERNPSPWAAVLLIAAGVCGVTAPFLPIVRWILARRHDPNSEDVEARKSRGQGRAVSKEQFLQMLQEEKGRAEAEKGRAEAEPPTDSYRPSKEWWER